MLLIRGVQILVIVAAIQAVAFKDAERVAVFGGTAVLFQFILQKTS